MRRIPPISDLRPADPNWNPVRRGGTYCSSACGNGCTYDGFTEATKREESDDLARLCDGVADDFAHGLLRGPRGRSAEEAATRRIDVARPQESRLMSLDTVLGFHDHGPAFKGCSAERHAALRERGASVLGTWTIVVDGRALCLCCRADLGPETKGAQEQPHRDSDPDLFSTFYGLLREAFIDDLATAIEGPGADGSDIPGGRTAESMAIETIMDEKGGGFTSEEKHQIFGDWTDAGERLAPGILSEQQVRIIVDLLNEKVPPSELDRLITEGSPEQLTDGPVRQDHGPPQGAEAEGALDPHFCDDGAHLSPFARFEPTERGWAAAIRCAAETAPEPDLLQPDERALVEGLERERIGLATGGERGLLAIVRRLARRRSK